MMVDRFPIISFLDALDEPNLPGVPAQNRMSPVKGSDPYREVPDTYKEAGVLALIYPKDDILHMVYIKRSSRDKRDKHAGQIGFPGGQKEEVDTTMQDTALRETYEEIGVKTEDIRILTPLTQLYVGASNFLVHPYLGYIDYRPEFIPQLSEVDDIIEVPLSAFHQGIKKERDFQVRNMRLKKVPYYDLDGHHLWGATAMITSEIVHLLEEAEDQLG